LFLIKWGSGMGIILKCIFSISPTERFHVTLPKHDSIQECVDDLEAIRGKLHEILQKIGKTKENDERREIVRGYLPEV